MRNRLIYKGEWSFSVRKDFVLNPNISAMAKMLYIAIRSFCSPEDNTAFPSSGTIAAGLGINRDTVFKYAQELEELNLLNRDQKRGEDNKFSHTVWTLFDTNNLTPQPKMSCTETPVAEDSDTKIPHKKEDVPKGECGDAPIEDIVAYWNSQSSLPKVVAVNGTRKAKIRTRWKESFWRIHWRTAINKIATSSWCTGKNERNWIADFDFYLRANTLTRAIEGRYDDRASFTPKKLTYIPDSDYDSSKDEE